MAGIGFYQLLVQRTEGGLAIAGVGYSSSPEPSRERAVNSSQEMSRSLLRIEL